MKKIVLLLLAIFLISVFGMVVDERNTLPSMLELTPTLAPITIEYTGLEYYYLKEAFGEEPWSPDAYEIADKLFECTHNWWDVATEEQLQTVPVLRVITICWEKVNE